MRINKHSRDGNTNSSLFLATAYVWGGILAVAILLGGFFVNVQQFYSPVLIAVVHVFTLGFLTQALLGFHELSLEKSSPDGHWSTLHYNLLYYGLNGGLIWFLGSMALGYHAWHLTLAATVLGYVLIHAGLQQGWKQCLRRNRGGLLRGVSFFFLAMMGFLGFTMAHNKWLGFLPTDSTLRWIETHAILGIGGWVGLFCLSVLQETFSTKSPVSGLFSLAPLGLLLGSSCWIFDLWYPVSVVKTFGQGIIVLTMTIALGSVSFLRTMTFNTVPGTYFSGLMLGPVGVVLTMTDSWFTIQLAGAFLVFTSCLFMVFLLSEFRERKRARSHPDTIYSSTTVYRIIGALLVLAGALFVSLGLILNPAGWFHNLSPLGGVGLAVLTIQYSRTFWKTSTMESRHSNKQQRTFQQTTRISKP